MIKQIKEFINEANYKVEQNAWRELILFTDNVQPIYSYLWSFVETLVSRGEKDNKQIGKKLVQDNYYKQELKHIQEDINREQDSHGINFTNYDKIKEFDKNKQ